MPDLFHISPPEHRDSIAGHGLTRSLSHAGRHYLAADPHAMLADLAEGTQADFSHHDIWQVDARGLELHDDPESPGHWGAVYTTQPVGPERLRRQADLMAHFGATTLLPIEQVGKMRSSTFGGTVEDAYANERYSPREQHYARQHGYSSAEEHQDAVRDHVAEHGIGNALLYWPDRDGHPLLGNGHHRYFAARDLGLTHLPVTQENQEPKAVPGWDDEKNRPKISALMAHFGEYRPDPGWTFYHGTPDIRTWGHGAHYGIHVGTEEAARQALHAKIGEPAEGTWDGTREYGKTLLKGQRAGLQSGYNMERRPDHYPKPATYHEPVRQPGGGWGHGPPVSFEDREPGKVYNSRGAVYSDSSPVPMDARPSIFPVRITGPMTNHPATPHEDFKANGYMAGALKRGNAKRGYFYRNVGEDEGSISAVVPSADHLERLDRPKTAGLLEHFGAWHEGPHYHGTPAELEPGDLIEPGKYPPSDPNAEGYPEPREHTYFTPRKNYTTEHYGPNVYEVEPEGDYTRDPEYGSTRNMYRSKEPLRVRRKVSTDWGLPHEGLLAHFGAVGDPAVPEAFPNPYHPAFGGRPEFSHTWFHGTKGQPEDLRAGRPLEDQRGGESGRGWPQPNKLLGTHFSPLHRVAHRFASGIYPGAGHPGVGSALVHARLHMRDPAHYPTEDHLNLAIAQWADKHHPDWHDDKLNANMQWQYSDSKGTRRNWHEEHLPGGRPNPHGLSDDELAERNWGEEEPSNPRYFHRVAGHAQQVLQWHPKLPSILHDFTDDLIRKGHHGITYGNEVEGPGQGSHDGEWDKEFAEHTYQDVRHISAIATRPSQIETTHVEHIAPPQTEPEPHEVEHHPVEPRYWGRQENFEHGRHGYSSELNEDKPMYDRVGAFHAQHGGAYPGRQHEAVLHPDPPDYAHGIQSGGSQVEWVRREKLMPYRNFHHDRETGQSTYLPTGHTFPDRYNRQRWDEMDSSVAEHGMHEPVLLEYNPWKHEMHIGEGNHRLESATRLGHEMVPVWGLKTSREDPAAKPVPGEPKVRPEHFEGGYFPSSFKPSDVLPGDWMHPGGQEKTAGHDDFTHRTGYVECDQGHTHWGPHGAAFLLLRHADPGDGTKRYLLQKRTSSGFTDHGGTWALPGGALQHEGEDSYAAARRESREEMGPLPRMKHHHTVHDDHGGWFADTHVADVQHRFQPHGEAKTGFEAEGHAWFTHDEIKDLPLHPGFRKTWDTVRRSQVDKEAAAGPRYYYGTTDEHATGDAIEHHYWRKYPDREDFRQNSPLFTTTDPALAGHMADLRERQSHGQSRGRMYEVRPTGPLEPDATANPVIKDQSSWQTSHPLHVVREIPRHEWPADLNSWQKTAAPLYREYVQRIHPRDLLPYAQREAWRMQDPAGRKHISDLAENIRQKGYKPALHGGMSGNTHSYPPSFPITLVHDDENSWLWNGHHRTFALNEAGYDKPVPVRVKDFRTKPAAEPRTAAHDAAMVP